MPLFIIAIIFLIGLLIYVIVGYGAGINDGPLVKERFPEKFRSKQSDAKYTVEETEEDVLRDTAEKQQSPQSTSADDKKNVYFPTENIELEKHKRNIH